MLTGLISRFGYKCTIAGICLVAGEMPQAAVEMHPTGPSLLFTPL